VVSIKRCETAFPLVSARLHYVALQHGHCAPSCQAHTAAAATAGTLSRSVPRVRGSWTRRRSTLAFLRSYAVTRPAGRHGFDDRAAVVFPCRFFSGFWSHRRVRVRAAAVTKSAHTAGLPSKTVRRSQVLRWASKTNDIFQTSLADIRLYSP
jgi:hypothetical protein